MFEDGYESRCSFVRTLKARFVLFCPSKELAASVSSEITSAYRVWGEPRKLLVCVDLTRLA